MLVAIAPNDRHLGKSLRIAPISMCTTSTVIAAVDCLIHLIEKIVDDNRAAAVGVFVAIELRSNRVEVRRHATEHHQPRNTYSEGAPSFLRSVENRSAQSFLRHGLTLLFEPYFHFAAFVLALVRVTGIGVVQLRRCRRAGGLVCPFFGAAPSASSPGDQGDATGHARVLPRGGGLHAPYPPYA